MDYRISSERMQSIVKDFTMGIRYWTAFSADKIEVMAIWSGLIPSNAHYKEFDGDREELVFATQPSAADIHAESARGLAKAIGQDVEFFSTEVTRTVEGTVEVRKLKP